MNKEGLIHLAESIERIGLLNPIILYEGKILDGKCRYEACKIAGVKPKFKNYSFDLEPLDYLFSANLYRKHFSEAERADIALELMEDGEFMNGLEKSVK